MITKSHRIRVITIAFFAGVGFELFMNLFTYRGFSIYRSISKKLSDNRAQNIFEAERIILERTLAENDTEHS